MCGIAGFSSLSDTLEVTQNTLKRMTTAIAHRGPDGSGHFISKHTQGQTIALGHRRLSIIDLGTGDQPMHFDDEAFSLVFNGEIYNYVELREELKALGCTFRTTSDTEVLLQAWVTWGDDSLKKFRGMFAFALWDKAQQTLFLARDHFGKKPLFYFITEGEIVFGSELAALAEHPSLNRDIDPSALADFMLWKYVPGARTLLGAVQEIPPGHFGSWAQGKLSIKRYYEVADHETNVQAQRPLNDDTVRDFRAALTEAVTIRLRSDVPLGAFLSGGIDSSAIVALMTQITGKPVQTFSVGFHEKEYSELWAARLIADRFKTDHHEIKISPEDFIGELETVTWQRGAPLTEMADLPVYALSKLAAEKVKVVLSGEGADELLGGYPKHRAENLIDRFHGVVPPFMDGAIASVGERLPYKYRRLAILTRAIKNRDFVARQAAWFGLMNIDEAKTLCPQLFADYKPFEWEEDPGTAGGSLTRSLKLDKTVWLPGTLLERGDRMTMAASIEGRMPFMDTHLAQFCSTLHKDALISKGQGKYILRQAMKNDLPDEILNKPKAGFRVPVHEWLRSSLQSALSCKKSGTRINLGAPIMKRCFGR